MPLEGVLLVSPYRTPEPGTLRATSTGSPTRGYYVEGTPEEKAQRRKRSGGLVDGIVNGERVLLATPKPEPLERAIEIRIRVAICAAGVLCWKHTVETCVRCGQRPTSRTGLGVGCADLICVVPPYGRFLAIEVKRPKTRNAKRDSHQRKWMAMVRRYGGVAGVATCEAEALALLVEARS